jgi:uncharacterized membrane protein HdeD (DUF308 family)
LKANLSALGDGIVVLGFGVFILSIAVVYLQSIQQSSSSSTTVVAGFFVFGVSVLIAGILKIKHAFSSLSDEKQPNLKTPITAGVLVLFMFYYLRFFIRF